MIRRERLEYNIIKYYLGTVFNAIFFLFTAILFIFYTSIGLTLSEIGIIAAFISVVIILFEIPSGICADKMGRKYTLALNAIFGIIFASLLFFADSLIWVLIATFFLGLKKSFFSGAGTSFIYDTHKELKKEKNFKEFMGKNFAFELYTTAIFFILAGFLAEISFQLIFIIAVVAEFIYLIIIASFEEPFYNKRSKSKSHLLESIKEARSKPKVVAILFYSFIIGGVVVSIYHFHQIFAKDAGFSIFMISVLFALLYVAAGISSQFLSKIEKRVPLRISLFSIPIMLGLIYIVMGFFNSYFIVWLVLFEAVIMGYFFPLDQDLQNKFISSKRRATILSLLSFLVSILSIFISLGLGFGSDILGIYNIYMLIGIFVIIFGTLNSFNLVNRLKL
jgi:MFS family permease